MRRPWRCECGCSLQSGCPRRQQGSLRILQRLRRAKGRIGTMLGELTELWRFRELLFTMVQRDLKIRYKNSALGFLWSLLNPLITVLVMTLVFKNYVGIETRNLSAYVLAAYLPFMFFQLCLMD